MNISDGVKAAMEYAEQASNWLAALGSVNKLSNNTAVTTDEAKSVKQIFKTYSDSLPKPQPVPEIMMSNPSETPLDNLASFTPTTASSDEIKLVQEKLGVTSDGIWGRKSQTAFEEARAQIPEEKLLDTPEQKILLDNIMKFDRIMEGTVTTAKKPPSSGSGITIGNGIDLSFITDSQQLLDMGISRTNVKKLVDAGALGKQGEDTAKAVSILQAANFELSDAELKAMNKTRRVDAIYKIKEYRKKYPNLSTKSLGMLIQAEHFAGKGFLKVLKKRQKFTIQKDGKNYNPLKDAIDTKGNNLTDQDVLASLETTRDYLRSVGSPLNATTFQRYINYIETGNPDTQVA